MTWPPAKKQLTIRLDEDVLDWLKRHGKGYQTRISGIPVSISTVDHRNQIFDDAG